MKEDPKNNKKNIIAIIFAVILILLSLSAVTVYIFAYSKNSDNKYSQTSSSTVVRKYSDNEISKIASSLQSVEYTSETAAATDFIDNVSNYELSEDTIKIEDKILNILTDTQFVNNEYIPKEEGLVYLDQKKKISTIIFTTDRLNVTLIDFTEYSQ